MKRKKEKNKELEKEEIRGKVKEGNKGRGGKPCQIWAVVVRSFLLLFF